MGALLGGLAVVFVGTITALLRQHQTYDVIDDDDDDDFEGINTLSWQSRPGEFSDFNDTADHQKPVSEAPLDGFTFVIGEAYNLHISTDSEGKMQRRLVLRSGYVEIQAPESQAQAFRLANVPRSEGDWCAARDWLQRGQLQLYDRRIYLEISDDTNSERIAWQLINLARCLIDGPAWFDWLADDRAEARDHRHLTLLRFLPTRPQAQQVGRLRLDDADHDLAGWAAVAADDRAALDRALARPGLDDLVRRRVFAARFQHGVAGFEAAIEAALSASDPELVRLALTASAALTEPEATPRLAAALRRQAPALATLILPTLGTRNPAVGAEHAFTLLSREHGGLRSAAIALIQGALSPEAATARALPGLLGDDAVTLEAHCDLLAKVGTVDAVWPLRELEDRTRGAVAQAAAYAASTIKSRQAGAAVGGLAISDAVGGALALDDDAG